MKHLECLTPDGRSLTVEDATVRDAAEVVAVHLAILEEGRYFITQASEFHSSVDQKAALIRSFLRQPNCCFLVARLEGTLVGMVSLRGGILQRMRHVAKLEIFVAAAARGQGVGLALMQTALRWARAHPTLLKVGLSVFDDNHRAISLYEKLGFIEEGRRPLEYQEPDGTLRSDRLMCWWATPDGTAPGASETPR